MARFLTSKSLRALIYVAADGRCKICGVQLPSGWHADHKIPFKETKTTNVHDMQALCPACNLKKGAKR